MCLSKDYIIHTHNRPIIAKEDIVCYKEVHKSIIDGAYITPYTTTIVPIECIENRVPFKAKITKIFRFFCDHVLGTSSIVKDGFIHVYTYPPKWCPIKFKCIIPKGTKYFIGLHYDLAAKEIIFLEEI